MDLLKETIPYLTEKEVKSFRTELQQNARSKEIVQLFDALCSNKEYKNGELGKKIYGADGETKYHTARRRLQEQLTQFLMDSMSEGVDDLETRINGLITISTGMIRRRNFPVAAEHLMDAIKLAEASHQYELLSKIYRLQQSHADQLVSNVPALCQQAEQNLERYLLVSRLNNAFALVRDKLRTYRRDGMHFDTEETIREVLGQLQYNKRSLLTNPVFMLRLMELVRSVVASGKDYNRFKPYLKRTYNLLLKAKAFDGHNAGLENDFIYMLAHVHYRTREFATSRKWLDLLMDRIGAVNPERHHLFANTILIQAGILFYSGKLQESIDTLKKYSEQSTSIATRREKLNMQLNLAVYTFFTCDYKASNRLLIQLPQRSKAMEEELGREWFFKRDLIEVIFQCEMGNIDYASSRLQSISKTYQSMLEEPIYQRARIFIRFMHHYFNHPEEVATDAFRAKVLESRIGWEGQSEDVQAILFFCWLRSKMQGRGAYEVMLERVREGMTEEEFVG